MARIGSLQFGQTRDVVVKAKSANISLSVTFGTTKIEEELTAGEAGDTLKKNVDRFKVINSIYDGIETNKFTAPEVADVDLKEDVTGQIKLAFDPQYFSKWGKYYLPSIANAHMLQQCNNFKDPGVQKYGGKDFEALRDVIDDTFNNLPPMEPSRSVYSSSGAVASASPVSNSMYNRNSDPCFSGDSTMIVNGVMTRVDEVKKGDLVSSGFGSYGRVNTVVKTDLKGRKTFLVELIGGAKITPWHPVMYEGSWVFPCDIAPVYEYDNVPAIYSFILDSSSSSVEVNGIPAVTLGHGVTGDIREHTFLGTKQVIEAVSRLNGYDEGLVTITGVTRDEITGLVNGFVQ